MPSQLPLPSVSDFISAYNNAVSGQKELRGDMRSGSAYNLIAGPAAILYTREVARDLDMFRAVYTDTCDGDDLTYRLNAIYSIPRILDTYGTGTAILNRPTTGAGQGTIFAGTRIIAYPLSGTADPKIYSVTADTVVQATQTSVVVPIRARSYGSGVSISASNGSGFMLAMHDVIFDNTLVPSKISCADGTVFESAANYKARVKQVRIASRVGYPTAIRNACLAVGATIVLLLASNFSGDNNDYGINACYVGSGSFGPFGGGTGTSSQALVNNCILALEAVRPIGADTLVGGIALSTVAVTATVSLNDDPGTLPLADISGRILSNLVAYFDNRKNAFSYQIDAIAGAIRNASPFIQLVTVTSPTSSVNITSLLNGIPQLPNPVVMYSFDQNASGFTFVGPQ